jgi:hypothetical protein
MAGPSGKNLSANDLLVYQAVTLLLRFNLVSFGIGRKGRRSRFVTSKISCSHIGQEPYSGISILVLRIGQSPSFAQPAIATRPLLPKWKVHEERQS